MVAACSRRRSAGAGVRAVQETGQEGPVRAGQVIVRLGCGVRGFVWPGQLWVQARCLVWSVCLRLKLTSALLGGRETNTEVPRQLPRTTAAQERAWANPHSVPRSMLTAMRLAGMHGQLTSCSSAQASVLSGLCTSVCMPRYGPWSRHFGARAVSP